MTAGLRPPPPSYGPPTGHEWVIRADNSWRVLPLDTEKRCRAHAGGGGPSCRRPAVAEFNRGMHVNRPPWRVESWWAYCERHLYGRWVEDGAVRQWVVRSAGEAPIG